MILFENELIYIYIYIYIYGLYVCICMQKWSRNYTLRRVSMDVLTEY
jgi:hypothetical protein